MIGWMAGVVDSKARVKITHSQGRKNPLLVLQVQSHELAVIRALCSLTGTQPRFSAEKQTGSWDRKSCIEHCPEPHVHVDRTIPAMGCWHVTGVGAAIVLYNLLPFLLSDRGFSELMRDAIAAIPESGQGRGAVDASIHRLRDLGWEVPPELDRPESP